MPPLRRSLRLSKKEKASTLMADEERFSTRQKKRREIYSVSSPSSDKDIPSNASDLWSDDSNLQLDGTTQLLKLVSVEVNPLIDEVVQTGALPRLVEFLARDDCPSLQFEAARVLKNITTGKSENTKMVIDCGALPMFVKLLEPSGLETCEQVVWALGNIAGDSTRCRDIVLNYGALCPLLTLLKEHNELSFLRIGTWALSNFLEGGPQVPFEQLESTIPVLASLVLKDDKEVLEEACLALSYLCHYGGGIISAMYEADLCSKLTSLFLTASPLAVCLAVRTIASIVYGIQTLDERAIVPMRRASLLYIRNDLSRSTLKKARCFKRFLDERTGGMIEEHFKKLRAANNVTSS